jgi:hypothetical protein
MYNDQSLFNKIAKKLKIFAFEPSDPTYSQAPELNPDNTSFTGEGIDYSKIFYTDPDFNIDPNALENFKKRLEEARLQHEKQISDIENDPEHARLQKNLYQAQLTKASELKTADLFKEICPTLKGRVLGIISAYPTVADLMKASIRTGKEIEGAGIDTWHKIMLALNELNFPMQDAGFIENLYLKYLEIKGKREIPVNIYFDIDVVKEYNPKKEITSDHGLKTSNHALGYHVMLEDGTRIIVKREDVKRKV